MKGILGAACLSIACVAPAALAQAKIDRALNMRYGGVLALDCSGKTYPFPMLQYLGDSLVVQDGGKPVLTGRNLKAVPTHFGAAPPPDFETAVTSDVAGGDALVFVFYRNASGLFVAVEGGPKTMAALPAVFRGRKVRHCDPNRNLAPGASPPVQTSPSDLLKDATFRQAYVQALGPLARERWLAKLDGPAPLVKTVRVAGHDYQLLSACKNHDCAANNIVVLYAAGSQALFGKVLHRGGPLLIGAPPAPVAAELEKIWKAEWRSGR